MPEEVGLRETLEGTMKMGSAHSYWQTAKGPGLPPSSTHTPQRNAGFENESWLEVNR